MRFLDFTYWQSILLTFIGFALLTLISMGIRLIMMFSIQQRRERVLKPGWPVLVEVIGGGAVAADDHEFPALAYLRQRILWFAASQQGQ